MHLKPQPKYETERPREPKAMTIAAAFGCSDGLILCADREMTEAGGAYKFPESKIYPIDTYGSYVALTFCGNPDYTRAVAREMAEGLNKPDMSHSAALKVIRTLPEQMTRQFAEPQQYLVAVAWKDSPYELWKFSQGVPSPVSPWDFIGCGDSAVARGLVHFFGTIPFMQIKHGAVCARWILRQVKQWIPYTGRETDVLLVTHAGFTSSHVGGDEASFASMEGASSELLSMFTNPFVGHKRFQEALEAFSRKVTEARALLFKP